MICAARAAAALGKRGPKHLSSSVGIVTCCKMVDAPCPWKEGLLPLTAVVSVDIRWLELISHTRLAVTQTSD